VRYSFQASVENNVGAAISIARPFGSFTRHSDSSRPGVFLPGGIGVTPFRSMILHASGNKLPHRLLLFYSNRRPEDAPFLALAEVGIGEDNIRTEEFAGY